MQAVVHQFILSDQVMSSDHSGPVEVDLIPFSYVYEQYHQHERMSYSSVLVVCSTNSLCITLVLVAHRMAQSHYYFQWWHQDLLSWVLDKDKDIWQVHLSLYPSSYILYSTVKFYVQSNEDTLSLQITTAL